MKSYGLLFPLHAIQRHALHSNRVLQIVKSCGLLFPLHAITAIPPVFASLKPGAANREVLRTSFSSSCDSTACAALKGAASGMDELTMTELKR